MKKREREKESFAATISAEWQPHVSIPPKVARSLTV
jgi:hypothetical protein